MPAAIIPLIGLISGLVGTGFSIDKTLNPPSGPAAPPPPTAAQNIDAATQSRMAQANSVNQQIPNIIGQTSGSLSGIADQTYASNLSGNPGAFGQGGFDLNNILSQFSNNGGLTGGGNPTDLLALATGGITG